MSTEIVLQEIFCPGTKKGLQEASFVPSFQLWLCHMRMEWPQLAWLSY